MPWCARRRNHRHRFAKPAAFGQLEIDAINDTSETRNVGRDDTRFVGNDWKRRPFAHEAKAIEVVGSNRSFDGELDAAFDEHVDHA